MGIVMRAQDASEDADEYIGAMSEHIVDDEQRSDRAQDPRPSGCGGAGPSASLADLDDVLRHRLRSAV